jgi:hypothetical protein
MALFKSNVTLSRMDSIVFEWDENPILDPAIYIRMIASELDSYTDQVRRIKLLDNGMVQLHDFTIPNTEKNLVNASRLNAADLPQWMKDRLSVLQICDDGEAVDGVGQKVSEKVFYVIE